MSFAAHALLSFLAVVAARHAATSGGVIRAALTDAPTLVWIPASGVGGGGGGGGDRMPSPPRRAKAAGADRLTVAVAGHPNRSAMSETASDQQQLRLDATPLSAGTVPIAGAIAGAPDVNSRGPGEGLGTGANIGGGDGPGNGDGVGSGRGRGCCDGAFTPGNGVQPARVIRQVRPNYTAAAVQAAIQGAVWIECIILPDGTVGPVRIVRSLDPRYGLDQEAIRAAKQWRFTPGMRGGKPVAVVATIELTFAIH